MASTSGSGTRVASSSRAWTLTPITRPNISSGAWRGCVRAKTARRHPHSLRRSHVLIPGMVLTAAAATLAPRPLRRLARLGMLVYAVAIAGESARIARRAAAEGGEALDGATLPAVFATMHSAWGAGFLAGSARFGPPVASLVR